MQRVGRPAVDRGPDVPRDDQGTTEVFGVFAPRFRRGTALICNTFFMLMLSFYFVLSWTPKNLVDLGFSLSDRIYASVLLNAGGIAGRLMLGFPALNTGARRFSSFHLLALFPSF